MSPHSSFTDTRMSLVDTPGPIPASLRARIAALEPGESLAEATRLMIGPTNEKEIAEETEKLRNKINPNVARAKTQTGGEYSVENGTLLTRSRDLIIVFVVTRK